MVHTNTCERPATLPGPASPALHWWRQSGAVDDTFDDAVGVSDGTVDLDAACDYASQKDGDGGDEDEHVKVNTTNSCPSHSNSFSNCLLDCEVEVVVKVKIVHKGCHMGQGVTLALEWIARDWTGTVQILSRLTMGSISEWLPIFLYTHVAVFIANTDTRWYLSFTSNLYRFLPTVILPSDVNRYHGNNERISIHHYYKAVSFYYRLIKNADVLIDQVPASTVNNGEEEL
uniref:N-acyl-aliphatic-L-amino acid amidohydrolase n=1 Tax=Timema shepardi TaxID=629360 RepID=A0A7R9B8X9_TIMSH|nr:unnamed protein product [Timema shepardi]